MGEEHPETDMDSKKKLEIESLGKFNGSYEETMNTIHEMCHLMGSTQSRFELSAEQKARV